MSRVVVFGGYGTFGGHIARELADGGVSLTIVGRDAARASTFAAALGQEHRGIGADVSDSAQCRKALTDAAVGVNCAGPFRAQQTTVLDACLDAGRHYVDIADDRAYAARVREYGPRFAERGLSAVYGCSSFPGISGALARRVSAERPERLRVTLFIGNNNPKGHAAVESLVTGLGWPIVAPQGVLRGFRDREVVPLPPPFGPRPVFNFDSPDYDLLPGLTGARSVVAKVGFELRSATYALALLARLPFRYGPRTAQLLRMPARLFRRVGSSGGAVMAEALFADGTARRAAVVARHDGQRMAALPCVYAVRALVNESGAIRGAATVYELLGPDRLLDLLAADGFEVTAS